MSETIAKPRPEAVPAELLRRIVEQLNPRRVILFGSRALGTAHEDSDWDLLVVVDDDAPKGAISSRALYEAGRGFRGAVDLLALRESSFQNRRDIVGSLPWIALTDGVIVYERHNDA